jgi:CHASE3 domain sensor protein/two-component sensor histidine kinase
VERNDAPRANLTLSGFAVSAVVALLLVGTTYWMSLLETRAQGWVAHSQQVLAALATARANLVDIQNGQRGFVISGKEEDLQPYDAARAAIADDLRNLRTLTSDNPAQQADVQALAGEVDARLAIAAAVVDARRTGGFADASRLVEDSANRQQMAGVRELLQRMETAETGLLAQRLQVHRRLVAASWLGMALLLAGLLAVLAQLYRLVRQRDRAERQMLMGIQRDLTEHRSAEEQLRDEMQQRARMGEELARLNAQLEALVRERTLRLQASNEALLAAKERLQALSARLMSAQEEERRHIARELHDETGQALTLIRMQLAELAGAGNGQERQVAECIGYVDRAIVHIRGLSQRLRPTMLDDLGLGDALEWVVEQQARAAGWRTHVDVPQQDERLSEEIETACFRICQEALTNAARHARAAEVDVRLVVTPSRLELVIGDDGVGFDLERYRSPEERQKHFGLVSMTERAALAGGELEVDTAPGHGTRIRAVFELARLQAQEGADAPASAPGELFA